MRAALKQRFGSNVAAVPGPQLKEATIQFLRNRTAFRDQGIPNFALVPRAAVTLGKWGEMRLTQVLNGAGMKPSTRLKTSLTHREIDRLLHGIAHESKGGIDVKLNDKTRTQILKDAELVRNSKVDGAYWHFFQGVQPDVLQFLEQNGIGYSIY